MPIESIDPLSVIFAPTAHPVSPTFKEPVGFGNWFAGEMSRVNQRLLQVDTAVQALAAGENVSLHRLMIDMEEAKLSFDLIAQVRNRLLESYQDVMRTQI